MEQIRALLIAIGDEDRASSRLRVHAWLPHLRCAGIDCKVMTYFDKPPGSSAFASLRHRLTRDAAANQVIELSEWADVLLLQEVLLPLRTLRQLQARRKHIIFDFSDPIHLACGPEHTFYHRARNRMVTLPRFHHTLRLANCAIVENDLLLDVVQEHNTPGVVIRGPVDTDKYQPLASRWPQHEVIIGWTGNNTTVRYLEPLIPVLARLSREFPHLRLHLFGLPSAPAFPGVHVEAHPWNSVAESTYVANFDIAIFHLPDSPWFRARGGSKLLTYMAAGLPVVSSHLAIGDQVIRHYHNGLLARTHSEWYDSLRTLIQDIELRHVLGRNARRDAVSMFSYTAYLQDMLTLLRGSFPVVDGHTNHPERTSDRCVGHCST